MNRRELLEKLMIALPAGVIAPSLLMGCKEVSVLASTGWKGKVIVIGAGASGMYAAYLLKQNGIDVKVLEASDKYGGRIRTLESFSDFPIELGAEEVHGRRSIWYNIIKKSDATFVEEETTDYMTLDGKLTSEDDAEGDADVQKAIELLENIEDYEGKDITAEQFIKKEGISDRVKHILEAMIGNEAGTSNSRIGIGSLAKESDLWTSGESNYLLKGKAHLSILEKHFSSIMGQIQLNTAIKKIDYSSDSVKLTDTSGKTHEADKVILTVPITILKEQKIDFVPALPEEKTTAFQKIGMDAGMKIILKFKTRFWDANLGSILSDGYVPEFWSTGTGRSSDNNVLTAFVHGKNAEYLSAQGENAVTIVLDELDQMFGEKVASKSLVKSRIMDWSKEPFIKGTYSYPKPNSFGSREIIAKPVNGKLFFAGEATNFNGHNATVHGALESGKRAVVELVETIK
jgi:monoamine oxidase